MIETKCTQYRDVNCPKFVISFQFSNSIMFVTVWTSYNDVLINKGLFECSFIIITFMNMSQHFWLGQLEDCASIEIKHSILIHNILDFADALKHNSTLKSLKVINSLHFHYITIRHEGTRAIAEALKVNSSLTSLNLEHNSIQYMGAITIADALKINSSLTSLNRDLNSIHVNGARAIADALKVNSSLTSLNLKYNSIQNEGAIAIADALKVNPCLTSLNLNLNLI
jgi:Ran GTPase-activating protein (RanGAP) involved in mRNA processing and transport